MRKNTLAVMISTVLFAAASAQAQPAEYEPTTPSTSATDRDQMDRDQATRGQDTAAYKGAEGNVQPEWKDLDTDGNGTLSQTELQAKMPTDAEKFSKIDADGDGQVSRSEMQQYWAQDRGKTPSTDYDQATTGSSNTATKPGYGAAGSYDKSEKHWNQADWDKRFKTADINGDKVLDQAEARMLPTLSDKFATVDADKNGKISMDEMHQHHASMKTYDKATQEADERRSTTSATSTTTTTTTDKDATDKSRSTTGNQ